MVRARPEGSRRGPRPIARLYSTTVAVESSLAERSAELASGSRTRLTGFAIQRLCRSAIARNVPPQRADYAGSDNRDQRRPVRPLHSPRPQLLDEVRRERRAAYTTRRRPCGKTPSAPRTPTAALIGPPPSDLELSGKRVVGPCLFRASITAIFCGIGATRGASGSGSYHAAAQRGSRSTRPHRSNAAWRLRACTRDGYVSVGSDTDRD